MKSLKEKNIEINKGQYLIDILSNIPTNTIVNKNVTNIGATTLEILSLRNSIIVLPNLPVIYQKEAKHKNTLGVHGDTTILKIIQYLSNTDITHKKILTTPESFHKVIEAFEHQEIEYKSEYFLLFDECDKISKDVHFRKAITLPMNHFFKFENKAFISATALIPRDPRFKRDDFEILNIVPTYDVSHDIKIYKTNNASQFLNTLVGKNTRNLKYFIFCNSINLITHIINKYGLAQNSSIFCSETSADKLKPGKFHHIGYKLDESKFSNFNFFTSRFYSAIDINIEEDIEVILLTDLGIAEYTIIDPETDAIQIIGRFRNKKIKKNITIITTEDSNLISLSEETCLKVIDCNKYTYDSIKTFSETLPEDQGKQLIEELQEFLEYNKFLKKNGSLDYFLVDNYINSHAVKHLYSDINRLHNKYKSLKISHSNSFLFNVKKYHETNFKIPSYSEKLLFSRGRKFKTIIKEIVTTLNSLKQEELYDISSYEEVKESYKKLYYDIVIAYEVMNHKDLLIIENPTDLKRELITILNGKITTSFPFLKEIQATFILGETISSNEAILRFSNLIKSNGLTMIPTLTKLQHFVTLKRKYMRDDERWGYYVSGYINNQ